MTEDNIKHVPAQIQSIAVPKGCPESGQFVAIWVHKGKQWSGTFKWTEPGVLCRFDVYNNVFHTEDTLEWLSQYNPIFIKHYS